MSFSKIFQIIVISLIAFNNAYSQRLVKYSEVIELNITSPKNIKEINYTALLPQNLSGRQEVLHLDFSQQPVAIRQDGDKRYADFYLRDVHASEKITMTALIMLHDNDLISAKKRTKTPKSNQSLKKYLKKEANFQVNSKKIRTIADSIKGTSDKEIAENIYQFVLNHLDYESYLYQNRGAKRALNTAKGDCTEYSELMVTLCRAKGIPARIVRGVVVANSKNPRHNWVEIYLKEYGWVGMDPTHGDAKNSLTSFENLENKYVYKSFSRFDESGWRWTQYGKFSTVKVDSYFKFEDIGEEYLTKAIESYKAENYRQTLSTIDTLLANDIRGVEYFALRGLSITKLGDMDKGLSNLKLAMSLTQTQQDKALALLAYANYYQYLHEFDKAQKLLDRAKKKGITPNILSNHLLKVLQISEVNRATVMNDE